MRLSGIESKDGNCGKVESRNMFEIQSNRAGHSCLPVVFRLHRDPKTPRRLTIGLAERKEDGVDLFGKDQSKTKKVEWRHLSCMLCKTGASRSAGE
jgi:hypothetical protein